jgi:hypothetical protein
MTTVTLSTEGMSVTFLEIPVPERPLCAIGLTLLEGALKRAEKALRNVNLPTGPVSERESERARLEKLFKEDGAELALGVPITLLPTLRVALALHYHSAQKIVEEQEELTMDSEEAQRRVSQLGRRAKAQGA